MGRPSIVPTMNYLKLVDQRLIEPIGILRNVDSQIMRILTSIDFEVINLVEGMPTIFHLFKMNGLGVYQPHFDH